MPTTVTRTKDKQLLILDENDQVIGVISRPVLVDVLGPGREKVYLARRTPAADREPHAA